MSRADRAQAGFTLLEVLAAVAIFAIWFTWLAATVMSGVARESSSHRRIEASLIADRVLGEIEAQAMLGAAPVVDAEAFSDDLYTVTIAPPAPFDLAAALAATVQEPELASLAASGAQGVVMAVSVEVAWQDGFAEDSVSRTTYVLNQLALDGLAAAGAVGGVPVGVRGGVQ